MTLLRHLEAAVRRAPGDVAFLEPTDDGINQVTFEQFHARVLQVRYLLHDRGVGVDDCVGIWLPNWTEALAWQFAASSLGAHVAGINTRYNITEVEHVLGLARPKVIALAHDFIGLDLFSRLLTANEQGAAADPYQWAVSQVVPVTAPGRPDVADLEPFDLGAGAWVASVDAPQLPTSEYAEPEGDHLAVAFTTSGSTGLPKLAAHSESGTLRHSLASAQAIGLSRGAVLLGALPFSGTFGFTAAVASVLSGATCLLHPMFDPVTIVDLIPQYGVSHLAFGDDMLTRVVHSTESRDFDFSSLRWVGIADFQGMAKTMAEWIEQHSPAHATGLYGSSEVFALAALSHPDRPAPDRWRAGGDLTNDESEYRTADDTQVIDDGSEAELQFRGSNVVTAYLGQPEQMERNFTADGWFRSGDLGRALGARRFEFICRMAEAMRLRGFLVEPDEIGNHLLTHPEVALAKVVGVRRDFGDEPVGFVTVRPGATVTSEELVAYCAEYLATYKVPHRIYIIDEMPVVAGVNGTKIRANVLKEWAIERQAKQDRPDSSG